MKSIKKNAIPNTLKIITGLCVALFFGINNAFASNIVTINNEFPISVSGNGVIPNCQSYLATSTNISGLDYYYIQASTTKNIDLTIIFCEGNLPTNVSQVITGTNGSYGLKCGLGDREQKKYQVLNKPYQYPLAKQEIRFEPFQISNEKNYFCIQSNYSGEVVIGINQNSYSFGSTTQYINSDFRFNLYKDDEWLPTVIKITELPDFTGNIQVGAETLLQYNRHNFCFLGTNEECHLKFNYGYDAIGSKILLTTKGGEFVASTTVADQYLLQDRFVIDEPPSAQTQEYCIGIDNGEEILTYCDITLEWISNSWCAEEMICAEVATSSDFLYGVQCGLRRTMCWIFQPTQSSISFLTKMIDNFTNSFPFNLPFDFVKQIDYSIQTASSSTKSFGLPMYSEETQGFYIVNGIDPGMYYEILGTSTVDTLENQVDMVLWLLVSLLIVFIIWKFAIHKK